MHIQAETLADVHIQTETLADVHIQTETLADVHIQTETLADVHIQTETLADVHIQTETSQMCTYKLRHPRCAHTNSSYYVKGKKVNVSLNIINISKRIHYSKFKLWL